LTDTKSNKISQLGHESNRNHSNNESYDIMTTTDNTNDQNKSVTIDRNLFFFLIHYLDFL
jgi:hypothetical protein